MVVENSKVTGLGVSLSSIFQERAGLNRLFLKTFEYDEVNPHRASAQMTNASNRLKILDSQLAGMYSHLPLAYDDLHPRLAEEITKKVNQAKGQTNILSDSRSPQEAIALAGEQLRTMGVYPAFIISPSVTDISVPGQIIADRTATFSHGRMFQSLNLSGIVETGLLVTLIDYANRPLYFMHSYVEDPMVLPSNQLKTVEDVLRGLSPTEQRGSALFSLQNSLAEKNPESFEFVLTLPIRSFHVARSDGISDPASLEHEPRAILTTYDGKLLALKPIVRDDEQWT